MTKIKVFDTDRQIGQNSSSQAKCPIHYESKQNGHLDCEDGQKLLLPNLRFSGNKKSLILNLLPNSLRL